MSTTDLTRDFEPSEKISLRIHATYLLCVATVLLFAIWAAVAELDVVSIATGEVIPSTKVKTIQHLEGGIVRDIRVAEGRKVTAGQVLVVLEPTASSADVGELKERLVSLKFDMARLEGLIGGAKELTLPEGLEAERPDLAREARSRFANDRQSHQANVNAQLAAIRQRQQEVREIQTRIKSSQSELKLVREQVKISEGLLKRDLTNRFLHLNLLKEQDKLQGSIATDRASVKRLASAAHEAQAELESIRSSFMQENRRQLDEARLNFRELNQRIQKYEDSLDRTVVRSPVDGTVKTLHVVTVGGVIKPGDPVVDIVPAGDRLIIEAQLPTRDIGYVEPGQQALIKLASADAARFSPLHGKVLNVSPDTLMTKEGNPFYKVRIETEKDHFSRGNLVYNLFPGMRVVASIQTGTRTVLHYLIDPYIANMGNAMGER